MNTDKQNLSLRIGVLDCGGLLPLSHRKTASVQKRQRIGALQNRAAKIRVHPCLSVVF
jgi:hypothetical protein